MTTIAYTLTDEAPALATRSLLPILEAFTSAAGIRYELKDISLAAEAVADHTLTVQEALEVLVAVETELLYLKEMVIMALPILVVEAVDLVILMEGLVAQE